MDPMTHDGGPAAHNSHTTQASTPAKAGPAAGAPASSLGELLVEQHLLDRSDVGRVLAHQQRSGQRFGEAVVALGLASNDAVVSALMRQYRYPCALAAQAQPHADLVTLTDPFGRRAECYRSLRAQLALLAGWADRPLSLAVIGPQRGEGRSVTAANLAVALAQRGTSTVLVDADLRRPRQQSLFAIGAAPGLSAVLDGRAGAEAVHALRDVPGLSVLGAGAPPPNPQELLEGPAFAALITELAGRFEAVVVDTPAATLGADAALVASRCSRALMVARRGQSRLADLASLQTQVARGGTPIAGVLLNEH
jgi:chain length determinant protein tyrosine kinase EpsG